MRSQSPGLLLGTKPLRRVRILPVIHGQPHRPQFGPQGQRPAFAWAQGENLAGLIGELLQPLFQPLPA
jgi:hypothetical protein